MSHGQVAGLGLVKHSLVEFGWCFRMARGNEQRWMERKGGGV